MAGFVSLQAATGVPPACQRPHPPPRRRLAHVQQRQQLRTLATAAIQRRYGSPAQRPQAWQAVSGVCAVALLLCNFHRSAFTTLLPSIAEQFKLSMAEVGVLQSAMLVGYLAGQLPSGSLSDGFGGERVLMAALLLWSLALAGTAIADTAKTAEAAMAILLPARMLVGLFSSCIMPAVSAAAARWVPSEHKASTIAMIYAFFNLGGVFGFVATPLLAARHGWPAALIHSAAGGLVWSLLGSWAIGRAQHQASQSGAQPRPPPQHPTTSAAAPHAAQQSAHDSSAAPTAESQGASPRASQRATAVQVAALCWAHAVIGWGFFTLQGWIPLYLESLGVVGAGSAGVLSALPWLAAAVTATFAGGAADSLIRRGRPKLAVRRTMHAVSTLGCAAACLPLAASAAVSPLVATVCLVVSVACYGFSFGGFHAYVQDVAQRDAGKLLGLTNSCSILGGILGNLATGWLLEVTGSYQALFGAAAALYVTSWAVFNLVLRGQPIDLGAILRAR